MSGERRIETTRIDSEGRVEIPGSMRSELKIEGGRPLFIAARDGKIILRPVSEKFVEKAKEIGELGLIGSRTTDEYSKNVYILPVPAGLACVVELASG